MAKRGENIYKRKDGRWEGRYIRYYTDDGKPKFGYIYSHSYSDAKKKLSEKKAFTTDRSRGSSYTKVIYNDLLTSWLQSSRNSIKESSYARYSQLIERHIRPYLGNYTLSKLTPKVVENYIDQQLNHGRLSDGGALSSKTVTDILTVIKSTLEFGRCNNMEISCNLNRISVKKQTHEMRVLSREEQETLVNVLLCNTDLYKFGILLSLYTGIRIGELCALKWKNIDTVNNVLKIKETMQRIQDTSFETPKKTKVIFTEPKSKCSIRDIPLPKCLIEVVLFFAGSPNAFVLTGDENKFVEPRTMQNYFKRCIRESGIQDANFHSLRHTFATRCVEVGFELKSLSEILGHSTVNITLNRYVHSSFELKHSNMDKLSFSI